MKRLFAAVPVSDEVKERIKLLQGKLSKIGADLKLVSLSQLHFTLKFLGDVDEEKIPEIEKRLSEIARDTKRFEVSIKGIGVFPSIEKINVTWVGTEGSGLVSLMKIVGKELDFIRKNEYAGEEAHLTIARVKSGKKKKELQGFVKQNKNQELGAMKVDKLILFESELTPEGPIHKAVKEFRLK